MLTEACSVSLRGVYRWISALVFSPCTRVRLLFQRLSFTFADPRLRSLSSVSMYFLNWIGWDFTSIFNGVMHGTVYTHKPAKSLMHRLNEILTHSITND